jgi:hypothetical protein
VRHNNAAIGEKSNQPYHAIIIMREISRSIEVLPSEAEIAMDAIDAFGICRVFLPSIRHGGLQFLDKRNQRININAIRFAHLTIIPVR